MTELQLFLLQWHGRLSRAGSWNSYGRDARSTEYVLLFINSGTAILAVRD